MCLIDSTRDDGVVGRLEVMNRLFHELFDAFIGRIHDRSIDHGGHPTAIQLEWSKARGAISSRVERKLYRGQFVMPIGLIIVHEGS
jgi:hypothetical protein